MASRGTRAAKAAEVAARRTRAVQLRNDGKQWQVIADELGYKTAAAACNDVTRAMEAAVADLAESVEVMRERELQRLDELREAVLAVLRRHHVTVQHGKVVRIDDEPLLDDAPVLAAVDRLIKIEESRRKLLGLDSATKVETSGVVTYRVEGVDLTALT